MKHHSTYQVKLNDDSRVVFINTYVRRASITASAITSVHCKGLFIDLAYYHREDELRYFHYSTSDSTTTVTLLRKQQFVCLQDEMQSTIVDLCTEHVSSYYSRIRAKRYNTSQDCTFSSSVGGTFNCYMWSTGWVCIINTSQICINF